MSSEFVISPTTALILIDVQKGFRDQEYWGGNRCTPELEKNISLLLEAFRKANLPILHVKHDSIRLSSPLHPSQDGNEIEEYAKPLATNNEPLLHKTVNSGFIGTDLEKRLRALGTSTMVITGFTTNHCCETTARMAGNLGFNVLFVRDATATFDRHFEDKTIKANDVHFNTLATLNEEFATIVSTIDILKVIRDIK
jgi:nicotinamidase-related amidase